MTSDQWYDAMGADELPADDVVGLEIGGRDIAVYRVEGSIYATDNACTHGGARLCHGYLEGHQIECPLHQGRFDIRDGRPLCDPVVEPLRTYQVKLEGARVYVRIT